MKFAALLAIWWCLAKTRHRLKALVDNMRQARVRGASKLAQMAELVDALVSGTSAERRGGSSPLLGTKFECGTGRNACFPVKSRYGLYN
jgi:hypothetical protein